MHCACAPASALLYEAFDQIASEQPDCIAVKTHNKSINYKSLSILSDQVAAHLIDYAVQPNELVAVIMEKGWEQVVTILGILKSGAAYIPIDSHESEKHIMHLLQVSNTKLLITLSNQVQKISHITNTIPICSMEQLLAEKKNLSRKQKKNDPDDLAYVIFTSGSTGAPKGVMISHQNVMNTLVDINARFSVGVNDKVLAISSLNFDLSVYDIFGTLLAGGTIVMPTTTQAKDPSRLDAVFFGEAITIWNSVPAIVEIFIEHLQHKYAVLPTHTLRLIFLSGDWIPIHLPNKIKKILGDVTIVSLGGATEASIWSIFYIIDSINPNWTNIPYGKPLSGQSFYILNRFQKPVKKNEIGQLFIGGKGVAKGYWMDKTRTKESFIDHNVFGRIYKTGDLGRFLPDGNIEFLGRKDQQVKIQGHRVELNGIESILSEHPSIKKSVVTAQGPINNKKLIAYILLDSIYIDNQIKKNKAFNQEQIQHWHLVHDSLYQNSSSNMIDYQFNTVGWTSSYTQRPIPKKQMLEWVEKTASRILRLKPKNILEVGCGSGLLLFRLFPHVEHYTAVDFSTSALQCIEHYLGLNQIKNVSLHQKNAEDISHFKSQYSLIIINSVVQYFCNVDYLLTVIEKSIDLTCDGGHVFIGDARSLTHFSDFIASILLSNMPHNTDYFAWKIAINQKIQNEEELLVDHHFFYNLTSRFKRIAHVEIMLKCGKYNNEMNNFRYDVILHIGRRTIEECKNIFEWKSILTINNLKKIINYQKERSMIIKNIPNRRTIGYSQDAEVFKNLSSLDNFMPIFKERIKHVQKNAFHPDLFYDIENMGDFRVLVSWSQDQPHDCFDVILTDRNSNLIKYKNTGISTREYTNSPTRSRFYKFLNKNLRDYLSSYFPHYMVPHIFVPMMHLPMSENGKIDRKQLAYFPECLLGKHSSHYEAPSTKIEKALHTIWCQAFGLSRVSTHDTYYEIGGTSLLAVQIAAEVKKKLGAELSIEDITINAPNIKALATFIKHRAFLGK